MKFISKRLLASSMALVLSTSASAATDAELSAFEKYQAEQSKQYQQYITDQEKAFSAYKQAYEEAFKAYTQQIEKKWDEPETSTRTKWVAYDQGYNQKTSVDYEKGQVQITQIVDNKLTEQQVKRALLKKLQSLAQMTYKQAYDTDPVAKTVDQEMQKKIAPSLVKSKAVPEKPLQILDKQPAAQETTTKVTSVKGKKAVTLTYQLNNKDVSSRVKAVLPAVMKEAERQGLPPAFVLAFIKNESSFNPMATSHIPAYGLMQIVPRSAGKDATQYLFGEPKLLSASYLYTPDKNIEVGVAYLYILYNRYLKKVKNPESRVYCTIAAYNTGAGNVAKAYTGKYSVSKAAPLINQQTPAQVYQYLVKNLPYDETKHYLKKVSASYQDYQALFKE